MLIDEVEAIWSAIDERDDWAPLHAKIAAIRDNGRSAGERFAQLARDQREWPANLISHEPATGAELWRGAIGDADAEVAVARASWAEWAAKPVTFRIETLRRYANVVRQHADAFADLIARETGKPLWEAKTEVASVIAKVDISVAAYSERTGQRRMEAPMQAAAWRCATSRTACSRCSAPIISPRICPTATSSRRCSRAMRWCSSRPKRRRRRARS